MQFFVHMKPPTTTFQAKQLAVKNGKPVIFDSDELKRVKGDLMERISRFAPDVPIDGPVGLLVKWCFPACENHLHGEWKTSKPDTDNLEKALKDCMTKLRFWYDDAQVCREITEKFYNDIPGIFIQIERLKNDT